MPVVTRSAYNVRRAAIDRAQILSECCRLDEICAICHDDMCGSDVYHLPCGHTFHKECLKQQIRHGRQWATKCAVCRMDHTYAIIQNPELIQHLSETVNQNQNQNQDENFENIIMTFMLPHLNNISGSQYMTMEWSADEESNGPHIHNVADIANNNNNKNNNLSPEFAQAVLTHLTQHIGHLSEQDDDDLVVELDYDLTSLVDTENHDQETGSDVETDTSVPQGESYDYDSENYDFAPGSDTSWTDTFTGTLEVLLTTDSASELEDDTSSIETNDT